MAKRRHFFWNEMSLPRNRKRANGMKKELKIAFINYTLTLNMCVCVCATTSHTNLHPFHFNWMSWNWIEVKSDGQEKNAHAHTYKISICVWVTFELMGCCYCCCKIDSSENAWAHINKFKDFCHRLRRIFFFRRNNEESTEREREVDWKTTFQMRGIVVNMNGS